jgi:cytochrome c oxidase cbb3-type subunit 3
MLRVSLIGKSAGAMGTSLRLLVAASALALVVGVGGGCKRELRSFRVNPPAAVAATDVPMTTLQAGQSTTQPSMKNPYEENAFALSEGQRLYSSYNCVGCHAHGGGGSGPPLMDDQWIYGSQPAQVYLTIIQGRPNGMPSFRGKIPDFQVWQLAAYVRSLSGLTGLAASGGRDDHMTSEPPPNSIEKNNPKDSSVPASAEGRS